MGGRISRPYTLMYKINAGNVYVDFCILKLITALINSFSVASGVSLYRLLKLCGHLNIGEVKF